MDSRLIYTVTTKLKSTIDWPKVTDTEWIYFGAREEVNKEIVIENIRTHFSEDTLNVAYTRNNSFQVSKQDIFDVTKNLLGVEDFSIWNQSFDRVIEFNRIGVLRRGHAPAPVSIFK